MSAVDPTTLTKDAVSAMGLDVVATLADRLEQIPSSDAQITVFLRLAQDTRQLIDAVLQIAKPSLGEVTTNLVEADRAFAFVASLQGLVEERADLKSKIDIMIAERAKIQAALHNVTKGLETLTAYIKSTDNDIAEVSNPDLAGHASADVSGLLKGMLLKIQQRREASLAMTGCKSEWGTGASCDEHAPETVFIAAKLDAEAAQVIIDKATADFLVIVATLKYDAAKDLQAELAKKAEAIAKFNALIPAVLAGNSSPEAKVIQDEAGMRSVDFAKYREDVDKIVTAIGSNFKTLDDGAKSINTDDDAATAAAKAQKLDPFVKGAVNDFDSLPAVLQNADDICIAIQNKVIEAINLEIKTVNNSVRESADKLVAVVTAATDLREMIAAKLTNAQAAEVKSQDEVDRLAATGTDEAKKHAADILGKIQGLSVKIRADEALLLDLMNNAQSLSRKLENNKKHVEASATAMRDILAPLATSRVCDALTLIQPAINAEWLKFLDAKNEAAPLLKTIDDIYPREISAIQVAVDTSFKAITDLVSSLGATTTPTPPPPGKTAMSSTSAVPSTGPSSDEAILRAMGGPLDTALKANEGVTKKLKAELVRLREALRNPTPVNLASLPLRSLAVVAYLAKEQVPPKPDQMKWIDLTISTDDGSQAVAEAMKVAGLSVPAGGWQSLVDNLFPVLVKRQSEIIRAAGYHTAPIAVAGSSATIVRPLEVPTPPAIPPDTSKIIARALAENRATVNRLDMEILGLMVAGFIAEHGTLTPDAASYAVQVAMNTTEKMAYCIENCTVSKILYQRLHPQGHLHPTTSALSRYREEEDSVERYASSVNLIALPENFADVIENPADTQSVVDAYNTYQAQRTPESYDAFVVLYHRLLGYPIAP